MAGYLDRVRRSSEITRRGFIKGSAAATAAFGSFWQPDRLLEQRQEGGEGLF